VLTGPVGELDVPETLHALAAARLDGLTSQERAVLQDAAVYGQSFTPGGVAALGSRSPKEVKRLLDGLVAKQILGFDDNPLSAERGQYHFLQGLLRTTAYGTLSRRDRKNRHLAAARHLQETWGDDAPELAEVLAAHFLDAANAEPEASDAPRIRAAACDTLVEAGRRALSLALGAEAQRAFERAAELADSDERRAELLHQAGRAALLNADFDVALDRLRQAVEIYERLDDHESAAKVIAAIAHSLAAADRLDEALELNRRALSGLSDGTVDKAAALSALARNLVWRGETREAFEAADAALSIAEPLQEWPIVVEAFNNIAVIRSREGRLQEGIAFRERSLALSLEHGLTESALRTYNNLADIPLQQDRYGECAEIAQRGLELARSRGDRRWEQMLILMLASARVAGGDWDALPPLLEDGLPQATPLLRLAYLPLIARVQAGRGDVAALERTLELASERVGSTNVEFGSSPAVAQAIALRALGRDAEALAAALPVATSRPTIANEDRREAYLEAGHAALALGDEATVQQLVEYVAGLPPAMRSPLLRAAADRFAGLLAFRRGDLREADARLSAGIREIRTVESPFNLAQMLLERAEILAAGEETDVAPLISEARAIFARLGATPWLERATALGSVVPA
jgi:tetratricopeptide (TPR) repeat protein